jgi:NAD(P)H-quinone oxidoreductase subunit 2
MSDSVKNYPTVPGWDADGMKPLQIAIVLTLVFTSVAGIASNPIFTLANASVHETAFLSSSLPPAEVSNLKPIPVSQLPPSLELE